MISPDLYTDVVSYSKKMLFIKMAFDIYDHLDLAHDVICSSSFTENNYKELINELIYFRLSERKKEKKYRDEIHFREIKDPEEIWVCIDCNNELPKRKFQLSWKLCNACYRLKNKERMRDVNLKSYIKHRGKRLKEKSERQKQKRANNPNFFREKEKIIHRIKKVKKTMKTIIANPPFSIPWGADPKHLEDDRFCEYEKLAPKSKADFAFIQDMLHKLDYDGIMSVVLPHGVLFRGGAEGYIRRHLIEKKNYIDAVIGLPANLFFGTSIPTCILVFRKNRSFNSGILFIDASREFQKEKTKSNLTDDNIKKITETFLSRKDIDKYSHLAKFKEVAENDFNLNIPRYVSTFEKEEEVDIHRVMNDIDDLYKKRELLDSEIDGYLKELGLK